MQTKSLFETLAELFKDQPMPKLKTGDTMNTRERLLEKLEKGLKEQEEQMELSGKEKDKKAFMYYTGKRDGIKEAIAIMQTLRF